MNQINAGKMKAMIMAACEAVIANQTLLCELDSHVGDGDHGVTVARGFHAVKETLCQQENTSMWDMLALTGDTLSETMGGAIGPIFGSIFSAMGEEADGCEVVDLAKLCAMFRAGLENVMMIGGAKPGDRTLVDTLDPVVRSLEQDAAQGTELAKALEHAVLAAEQGALATKNMVAKKGRAKFLQEKSVGYQDAGATSMLIVIKAMAESAKA